jgi:hypothetical protein
MDRGQSLRRAGNVFAATRYKGLAVTKLCLENTGRSVYSQYRVQDDKQNSIFNVLLMRERYMEVKDLQVKWHLLEGRVKTMSSGDL